MGLALVERNVAAHRGRVAVESGKRLCGARFVAFLPRRHASEGFGDSGRRNTRSQMPAQPIE